MLFFTIELASQTVAQSHHVRAVMCHKFQAIHSLIVPPDCLFSAAAAGGADPPLLMFINRVAVTTAVVVPW